MESLPRISHSPGISCHRPAQTRPSYHSLLLFDGRESLSRRIGSKPYTTGSDRLLVLDKDAIHGQDHSILFYFIP